MSAPSHRPNSQHARTQVKPTRLGDWSLFPELGVIRYGGTEKRLGEKPLHVLLLLIQNPAQGISRNDILQQVWGSNYPSDTVVSKAIAELRAAFGEKAGQQKYIRTLPKYGYQWIAPIGPLESQATTSPVKTNSQRKTWLVAIALLVLVLVVLSTQLNFPSMETSNEQNIVSPSITPLTSAPGLEHLPRISPNQRDIVYAAYEGANNNWDLYLLSRETRQTTPIANSTRAQEYGAAFSADGQRIAFVYKDDVSCRVMIRPVHLGNSTELADCTTRFLTVLDWSPTRNLLAYTADDHQQDRRVINLLDPQTKQFKRLTEGAQKSASDFYPRFSPDGKTVAFLRGLPLPDHRTELWVIDIESGTETLLQRSPARLGGMAWLDNSTLIYSLEDAGGYTTRQIDISSQQISELNIRGLKHFEVITQKQLAAVQQRQGRNIFGLSNTLEYEYFVSNYDESYPRISPDGKWLAFISRRTGFDELWIGELATGAVRQLTRFSGATLRYPDWHPTGNSLLFTAQHQGPEIIQQVNIISGTIYPLERDTYEVTTPRWLPDGEAWVFGCQMDGSWGICINDNNNPRLLISGMFQPKPITSDTIAMIDSRGALYVFNIATADLENVYEQLPNNGRNAWLMTKESLFFTRKSEHGELGELVQYSRTDNYYSVLYTGPIDIIDGSLSFHADTQTLFFSVYSDASDDVVEVELK